MVVLLPAVGSVALPAALRLFRLGATVACGVLFVAGIGAGAGAVGGAASLAVDVLRRRLAVNRGARRRRFVAAAAFGLAVPGVPAAARRSEVCVLLLSLVGAGA